MKFSTLTIHSLSKISENSLTDPLHLTATHTFDSAELAVKAFKGEHEQFVYGRVHNPTQSVLENKLSVIEDGEASLVLSSGIAALAATFYSLVENGVEIVVHYEMYGNALRFFKDLNVPVHYLDLKNNVDLEKLNKINPGIIFFETLTNPRLDFIDVSTVISHIDNSETIIIADNTMLSPYLYNPLKHGAHICIHSLTKYINGHGDVMGGAVIGEKEIVTRIRKLGLRYLTGSCLSPFNCLMVLRGLKTLALRMEKHSHSALKVSEFLRNSIHIDKVYYPKASKYFNIGSGLVSFEIAGGGDVAMKFMNNLNLIKIGVSFGDAESLIQHPFSMTHSNYQGDGRFQLEENLVRLSIGLEDVEDLLFDLKMALERTFS